MYSSRSDIRVDGPIYITHNSGYDGGKKHAEILLYAELAKTGAQTPSHQLHWGDHDG